MKDYYLILNIEPNATTEEIKKAYKQMSLKYHPDKNQGDKYFEERFKDIGEAYSILSNHDKRRQYDYDVLNGYRNAGSRKGNSNQASGQDSSYSRREDAIRQRQQQLDQLAKQLDLKGKELDNMYEAFRMQKGKATGNRYIKGGLIFFSLLCIISSYLILINRNASIEKLNTNIDTLNATIKGLDWQIQTLKRASTDQQKTIAEQNKQLQKPKWTPPVDAIEGTKIPNINDDLPEIVKLENRVVVKRTEFSKYAVLSNLNWRREGNNEVLVALSVYNNGFWAIKSITISYDIKDKYGAPINSGEFVAHGEIVESKKAKILKVPEIATLGISWSPPPSKRLTDVIFMTIKSLEYKN